MPIFDIPEIAQQFWGLDVAPRVDREDNRKQEADENGQPLWEARVVTLGRPDGSQGIRVPMPEVLRVTVAGPKPTITTGAPTRFRGLTLRSWSAKDGRQGLMYMAEEVVEEPESVPPASSVPAGPAPSPSAPTTTPGPERAATSSRPTAPAHGETGR